MSGSPGHLSSPAVFGAFIKPDEATQLTRSIFITNEQGGECQSTGALWFCDDVSTVGADTSTRPESIFVVVTADAI
jgi:hypothetical protein